MKKLNFLSNLCSSSRTDRVRTLAIDAVSLPSFCRVNMLKLVSVLVVLLTIGVGNVWGAPVTIVSWDGAARTANSQVSPTSSQTDNSSARLKSECALSTAGSGGCAGSYYSTWTNGNCIYLTSLSLSGYTDVSLDISLRRRNGTCTAAFYASTDGSSYAGSAFDTETLTNSCANYSVDVASNVKAIKIVIDGGSGNLWLGDVSLSGTAAAATPTVTPDPTSLDWGTVLQGSSQSTKTISISGSNLTAGSLTISATGGYSVTPISKSVSGTLSATTLTVTPPSTSTTGAKNGKVTISGGGLASAVEVNLSMTVNAASTVTWMNNGSEYTTTLVANGSKPEFPDNPSSCDGTSTTFYGWSTSEWAGKLDDVSAKNIYTSASAMPNVSGDVTYYAVFAKGSAGNWSITSIDKLNSSSGYAGYNGSHTASTISYTSSQVMQNSGIQFQSNSGYMYNTTAMSSGITSIVITSTNSNWSVYSSSSQISSTPASGAITGSTSSNTHTFTVSSAGHKYFHIKGGSSTPVATNITVNYASYSKYLTNCCTNLGTINGSFC